MVKFRAGKDNLLTFAPHFVEKFIWISQKLGRYSSEIKPMVTNKHGLVVLIEKKAKESGLKQPDLAKILDMKDRQYRRRVKKGLTIDEITVLLNRFDLKLAIIGKINTINIPEYDLI